MDLQIESYKTFCVSTFHVTPKDTRILAGLAANHTGRNHMILMRDSGYFIKLYEPPETMADVDLNQLAGISLNLRFIIQFALHTGHRMIEIDCDAARYDWMLEAREDDD